ncbi:hypothetical protein FJZ18_00005 [Candidatus Pacearchaeota archaeon]|nr:hypothetical protein [Candidatus Pacearchaeota archaeon]
MKENIKTRQCPDGKHLNYTLQRYYLNTREAEMKCMECDYRYFRPMSDVERFNLRNEVNFLVDASTQQHRKFFPRDDRK